MSGLLNQSNGLLKSNFQLLSTHSLTENSTLPNGTTSAPPFQSDLTHWQIVLIVLGVAVLVVLTVVGNLLVLVSFRISKRLQTVSNYFLLSLAVADLMIGLVSMPLFTMFLVVGRWPLGRHMCNLWLCMDYTISNASVANLLIICFDRYLSVTRPLTYMTKRTPRRAGIMISCAWGISILLWAPWILLWEHIEGERTVPKEDCYVQFLNTRNKSTNQVSTIITSIAAFYLPVTVMAILYFRIFLETRKRQRELQQLQGGNLSNVKRLLTPPLRDENEGAPEAVGLNFKHKIITCLKNCCEIDPDYEDSDSVEVSEPDHAPLKNDSACDNNTNGVPSSRDPLYSRSFLFNFIFRVYNRGNTNSKERAKSDTSEILESITTSFNERIPTPKHKEANLNTICEQDEAEDRSILSASACYTPESIQAMTPTLEQVHKPLLQVVSNTSSGGAKSPSNRPNRRRSLPKSANDRKQDGKAAKTLSAILLAFICTWSPYIMFTLINAFWSDRIPLTLYYSGYWLCYINSTINPVCYALCNNNFRKTFTQILTCNLHTHRPTSSQFTSSVKSSRRT